MANKVIIALYIISSTATILGTIMVMLKIFRIIGGY
jgi:hypothetical protein